MRSKSISQNGEVGSLVGEVWEPGWWSPRADLVKVCRLKISFWRKTTIQGNLILLRNGMLSTYKLLQLSWGWGNFCFFVFDSWVSYHSTRHIPVSSRMRNTFHSFAVLVYRKKFSLFSIFFKGIILDLILHVQKSLCDLCVFFSSFSSDCQMKGP